MTTKVASPRARKSFSRIENVLELPNLIDIQIASFKWFLDEGLRETIDTSSNHLDVLAGLKRVNSLIAGIAYAVLGQHDTV